MAEILRRKSTARISACPNALQEKLSSSGNSAAEIHSENHDLPSLNLTSSQLAEILRRKSTARISACLKALREMLSSSGNSAAEIHRENLPSLNLTSSELKNQRNKFG